MFIFLNNSFYVHNKYTGKCKSKCCQLFYYLFLRIYISVILLYSVYKEKKIKFQIDINKSFTWNPAGCQARVE